MCGLLAELRDKRDHPEVLLGGQAGSVRPHLLRALYPWWTGQEGPEAGSPPSSPSGIGGQEEILSLACHRYSCLTPDTLRSLSGGDPPVWPIGQIP